MILRTPTFEKIGGTRVLKDLKLTSLYDTEFDSGTFWMNFYDKGGFQRKLNQDAWIVANHPKAITDYPSAVVMVYFDEADGHWYLSCDSNAKAYCMDDYPLVSGAGFVEVVGSDHGDDPDDDEMGVVLTCSGEVAAKDTNVRGVDEMLITGNQTPRDRKLSDITLFSLYETTFDSGTFWLNFYDKGGFQRKLNQDAWIVANYPKAITDYPSAVVMIYFEEADGHWYLSCDAGAKKYCMDNYPVKANDGFLAVVGSDHGDDPDDDEMGVLISFPKATED